MASVFFSYSHKDEELRDRLEAHLAILKRQGAITTWHDRRITAGSEFAGSIDKAMEEAEVILLLVSSDFLASDYCYDVEMTRALERHAEGSSTVIPIILRHCDWHHAPFGNLLAAPRDGKPIVSWPDLDEAFLDVVTKIRAALPKPAARQASPASVPSSAIPDVDRAGPGPRSSNLSMSKSFTEADRDRFLGEAFEYIAKFFENSVAELARRNNGVEGTFKRVDADTFTAVIYKSGTAAARCRIGLGGMFGRGISFSHNDNTRDNSMSESLSVEADPSSLFLKALGLASFGSDRDKKLTYEGAAEYYWSIFFRGLQSRDF